MVEQLEQLRRPDGPRNHPLSTLVPERWLRSTLLADPGRIGCDELVSALVADALALLEALNVEAITAASRELIDSLVTNAPPKDREVEAIKARERARVRYGRAS